MKVTLALLPVLALATSAYALQPPPVLEQSANAVASSRAGDVCDLDNSCNTTTTMTTTATATEKTASADNQTERADVSDKWKYNISDGVSVANDSVVDIYRINESNTTSTAVSAESDVTPSTGAGNASAQTNDTTSTNTKFQIRVERRCFCDLKKRSCDLNCCCDQDCLYVNRDVFTTCNQTDKDDEDVCQSKILNSPLLCIVKDNLYSRHFYTKHEIPVETMNVDKILRNRRVYGWTFPSLPPVKTTTPQPTFETHEYAVGSSIWIFANDSKFKKFEMPKSTLVSRDCLNTEPVAFLTDYETVCTHRVAEVTESVCAHNNSVFNPARYFAGFRIISNPSLVNLSTTFNCTRHCIRVTPFVCDSDDNDSCRIADSTLKSSLSANVCRQAVTEARYRLVHNGTEGIFSATVYLRLINLTLVPDLLWSFSLKLTHEWVNQTRYYELSGYPGYVFGRPLITGTKIPKERKQNRTEDRFEMSHHRSRWLTILRTDANGGCVKTRRRNVLFGENIYVHCFAKVPKIESVEQCEHFQQEILKIAYGTHFNLSTVHVSTRGDPDIRDKSLWTPLVFDMAAANIANDTCAGIVTAMKMVILHANEGEHDDPQQTIVGVKVTSHPFDRNVRQYEKLKISISVNFYDVTNPPLRVFGEPPTYEVKLPTDFFYPFFSNAIRVRLSKYLLSAILFCGLFQNEKFTLIFIL